MLTKITNTPSFKGYDAIKLRALYMQGLKKSGEIRIYREMKAITDYEGIDLFINRTNLNISEEINKSDELAKLLSIWGQDRKAFVKNKLGKIILWNTKEPVVLPENLGKLSDFGIMAKSYMPRGGDYYIGYKNDGTKWLLINGKAITGKEFFESKGSAPTKPILEKIFNVKSENIYSFNILGKDLDEVVRPIGYPYILVNDYDESLKNIEEMKRKFLFSETYKELKGYVLNRKSNIHEMSCDEICKYLQSVGFKPVKIGANYHESINYINAIAMKNQNGKITYISNSTRKSYPELAYLEQLFDRDLKERIPNISDTYYISGGKLIKELRQRDGIIDIDEGFANTNVMMDIFANRLGGIHCMTAEIPTFEEEI